MKTIDKHALHDGVDGSGPVRFSPLMNDAFLSIFGGEGAEGVTRSLVNALLRMAGLGEIGEIDKITADSAQPGGVACRTARCDVLVESDGDWYDLESQGYHAHVGNKSVFYASRLIT